MALAVIEADRFDLGEVLQRPGETDGGILPAGKQHQRVFVTQTHTHSAYSRFAQSHTGATAILTTRCALLIAQARDLLHLGVRQLEIENRDILLQPLHLAGARNDAEAALHEKAQRDLRRALAMPLADGREHAVIRQSAPRHRAISDHANAVLFARRDHLALVEIGMHLDLVAGDRLAGELHRLIEQRDGEIRHADVTRAALFLHLAQRADGVGERHLLARPMQQQKIDMIELHLGEALLERAREIRRRMIGRPDLGGDESFVARQAGGAQAFGDLGFVLVGLRGVEMAIADLHRFLRQAHAIGAAQFPGAEPDGRHMHAGGFNEFHLFTP